MARTTVVEAFRGQRKCQVPGCGKKKSDHGLTGQEVRDHDFQTSPLRCEKCGKDIEIGMGYKHVSPRAHRAAHGFRKVRCLECPAWKQSELTSSPVLSVLYAGQETADDELSRLVAPDIIDDAEAVLEELRAIAEAMGEAATEAAEMRHESAEAIEGGFGHETEQSAALQYEGDDLESWAGDLENINLEDFTEESGDVDLEEQLANWFDTQVGEVSEVVGQSPL